MKNTVLICLLILVGLAPMWQWADGRIPRTHDFDLQVARIASFSVGLGEGNIFPRWGGNLNWGYGHPSLMFLYPLTSYIGGLLSLTGLSFVMATKLTFALAAAGAAVGMWLFLRRIFSVRAAALGTVLYLLAPYRLVDINVRGALGELAGLAVIPWVFWRFWELLANPTRKNIAWAGLSIFLLILAHNAVGMMGLGMLGIWLTGLIIANKRMKVVISAFILGVGMSSFYLIPGLVEGKYTFQKEFTNLEIYASRFPAPRELLFSPWGYGPTPENGRPAGFTVSVGWGAIGAIMIVIPALSWNLSRIKSGTSYRFRVKPGMTEQIRVIQFITAAGFLVIFLIGVYFLTPLSVPVVEFSGIIQRFQFPWRWLAMTVTAGAVLAAAAIEAAGKRWIWAAGLLGAIVIWQAIPGMFTGGYEDLNPENETFSGPVAWTTDTGESTPRWATRFQDKYPKSAVEVVWGADVDYQVVERKQEKHRYLIEAKVPTQVVDNTLYFPGWKVKVGGQEVPIEYQDQSWRGLITFGVPAGRSEVEVVFTQTLVRKLAAAITLVSFAVVIVLVKKKFKSDANDANQACECCE